MGIVIGYKGTAKERKAAWTTMLALRKRIRNGELYIKTNPEKEPPDLTQSREWLAEEFEEYTKAA